jgi:hypothetical protein
MSEEHRFDFKGSFNDFLDAAYRSPRQENGERRPVGGPPSPAMDADTFLEMASIGIGQFGRDEAFALLLHPDTKFEVQAYWMNHSGGYTEVNFENLPDSYEGCLLQSAVFVEKGKYIVVGKADYEQLVEASPEAL